MPEYERVTYGTATIYLEEGMYSLTDLQQLVDSMIRRNKSIAKMADDSFEEILEGQKDAAD